MDNSIEIAKHYNIIREEMLRPSVKYQQSLKIGRDGDMFCVLMGENGRDGVVGFGETLNKAINDFDTNFSTATAKKEVHHASKILERNAPLSPLTKTQREEVGNQTRGSGRRVTA